MTKIADKEYIASTYGRFDLEIVKGEGSYVYDEKGKDYIDLNTGIAVNTFGYCDKEWINAVSNQLSKFQHTSNLYYSEPCVKLAELLAKRGNILYDLVRVSESLCFDRAFSYYFVVFVYYSDGNICTAEVYAYVIHCVFLQYI